MIHLDDERIVDIALHTATAETRERAHLDGCPRCAALLESLTDTMLLTRTSDPGLLVDPPPRVWESIQAEIRSDSRSHLASADGESGTGHPRTVGAPAAPPGGVTSLESRRRRPPASRPMGWLLAAACVVGIVLGVGGATVASRLGGPAATETTVATADLAPLDSPATLGVASLVDHDGGLRLDLSASDLDPEDGYLEVWLINRDLTRMVSIGVLPADADQIVLPVSQRLIDEGYVIVDISREPFDDQPGHSGATLVRGELPI
jgi:hypothetical protein